jgi:hypothetical protein
MRRRVLVEVARPPQRTPPEKEETNEKRETEK